jgi:hypothetical protein
MASINLIPPKLSYVGAVDVASSGGSTLYNLYFDETLATAGNVLMFEYKLQPENVINPDQSVFLGFINTEDSNFQSGIVNQWQISVPAFDDIYDPSIPLTIQVRVYSGAVVGDSIVVTEWSNALDVHNPPATPTFYQYNGDDLAFYDVGEGLTPDDLYIGLTPDPNYSPLSSVNFIVAYYYTDENSGTTVWNVSSPIAAVENTTIDPNGIYVITVPGFGKVSSTPGKDVVYVAVYAVFDFLDASGQTFYSVSHISTRVTAYKSSYFEAPILNTVNYLVYSTVDHEQTMELSWLPPANSLSSLFTVDRYVLQVSVNDGSWNVIDNNISPTTTTYDYPVSAYPCKTNGVTTNLNFKVYAVNTSGGVSPDSDEQNMNMFRYSEAPQNLVISNVSISGQDVTMIVSFDPPASLGCGEGHEYIVTIDGQEQPAISYVSGSITQTFTGLNISSSGIVSVYLQTYNTNPGYGPGSYADGDTASTPYIAIILELNPIFYEIYNPAPYSLPIMDLSWNFTSSIDWNVDDYVVEVSVNDGSFNQVTTTSSTSYNYDTIDNGNSCDQKLTFRITANLSKVIDGVTTYYSVLSNTEFKNIYEYSQAPTGMINWAVYDSSTNIMDINMTIYNPSNIGCGDGEQFVINVYDNNSNLIRSLVQNYDPSSDPQVGYDININDLAYYPNGSITVYLETTDTNSNANDMVGAVLTLIYTSDQVPIYRNITLNSSTLIFDVISANLLAPVAGLVYPNNGALSYINWLTNVSSQSGITVVYDTGPNGEHIYTVTIDNTFTGGQFPSVFGIVTANTAGIGELGLPLA